MLSYKHPEPVHAGENETCSYVSLHETALNPIQGLAPTSAALRSSISSLAKLETLAIYMYPDSSDLLTTASVRVMAAIEDFTDCIWLSHNVSTQCTQKTVWQV